MAAPVYIAMTGTPPAAACAAIEAYLPSSHGLDTVVEWSPIIAEATAFVDARLSPRYWPFPDIAGTPATPTLIAALAARYGAYVALMKLGPASRFADMSWVDKLRADVTRDLDELCDEKLAAQVPLSTVTAETINIGSISTLASEHVLLCGRRDVSWPSVVVTDAAGTTTFSHSADYYIYYNTDYQSTMLVAVHASIVDGCKVTYDYSHIKRAELDLPPGHDTIRLVRA